MSSERRRGEKRGPYKQWVTDHNRPLPKRSRNFYHNDDPVPTSSHNHEENVNIENNEANHGSNEASGREQGNNSNDEFLNSVSDSSIVSDSNAASDKIGFCEAESTPESVSHSDREENVELDSNHNHNNSDSNSSQEDSAFQSVTRSRQSCSANSSNQHGLSVSIPPVRMMINDRNSHNGESSEVDGDEDQREGTDEYLEENGNGEVREEEQLDVGIFCDGNDFEQVDGDQQHEANEGQNEQEQREQEHDEEHHQHGAEQEEGEQPGRPLPAHQNLWKEIRNQPDFISSVLTEVNCSPAEILLKILALSHQNNFSFKAFLDTVLLVNSLFVTPVLPGTQYLLDKLLLSETDLVRYFYCKTCSHSFGNIDHNTTPEIVCPACRTINEIKDLTKACHFVLFDIGSQLELLFMNKEVRENLVHPKEAVRLNGDRNVLKDVYDGKCYREFAASLANHLGEKILSFVVCTDGSPLFKSSNYSVWPFFLCINELPPLLRMKNLLLGGLWFGNRHPPMDLYLQPVVNHLKSLSDRGIKVTVEEEEWLIKAYTIACCVDSGARGAVQGVNSHSGYYSCNWCLIPGLYLENKVVFPFSDVDHPKRTHETVKDHGAECLANDALLYVFGVQYVSPLVALPKFDIVLGMVQDFPHNVPFGIGRTFLDEWLHNSQRSFYIGSPEEMKILNKRMEKLKPCIEVRRAIRPLKDMAFWKAREFENWVVIYSLIVVLQVLPAKFWTHWSYLVQAVYLLVGQTVTTENVNMAHKLIRYWVADVETLYGQKFMSFNVHIFSHFAENVSRWGPAWAVSTYCFESAIGKLKNTLHAHRGVPHQINREMSYNQARNILINSCSTPRTEIFIENIKSKPNKMLKYLSLLECAVIGKENDFVPTVEEQHLIRNSDYDIMEGNCVTYHKIIASRCVFTTDSLAAGKKFNNSVALTNTDSVVILKKFIRDKNTDKVYAFCSEVVCREFLKFPTRIRILPKDHCVRIVSSIARRLKLVSVKDLKISCVYTKMEENDYVTPFHNLYNVC
ncbi:Halomucin [Frankliniella fusca]|uniref:Halomucin n=1 Tax=Frankliniella fusca TaxID=407009 RepID=A0AAE1GW44_9NEOP|nr:Halomucin [Frankliniella fusca]